MAKLKVAFLNVGHGDFVYALSPLGDTMVIDVGTGDVVPSEFLSPVKTINELQISHPHTDHFDDIVEMSKKTIRSLRMPNLDNFSDKAIGWRKSDKEKIAALRALRKKVPQNNSAVSCRDGFSHSVWTPTGANYDNPNTASLVTILSYGNVKILFGGDLPDSGWQSLLLQPNFVQAAKGTTIFKVPHHGRKEGCSEALFKLISPKLCVISDKPIGAGNENTVATDWYTKRTSGCNVVGYKDPRKVLSTRNDGSIFVEVDEKDTWRVYPDTRWRKD